MKSRYLTVVLRMPDDAGQRVKVVEAIGIGKNFHGAEGVAMSAGDEMTLNEFLIEEVGEDRADELRAKVQELHAQSEVASG